MHLISTANKYKYCKGTRPLQQERVSFAEASDQQASHFLPGPIHARFFFFCVWRSHFRLLGVQRRLIFVMHLRRIFCGPPKVLWFLHRPSPVLVVSCSINVKNVSFRWPFWNRNSIAAIVCIQISLWCLAPEMTTAASPRGVGCPSLHLTLLGE